MIYFFADEHYAVHPGKTIFEHLPLELRKQISFHENGWDFLNGGVWEKDCSLLILNMIGGTCDQPLPGPEAENAVKKYCARSGNILLLHGSSAAFWHWPWWRKLVGLRWVRPHDPDEIPPSTHPVGPCLIKVAKTRHPLTEKLLPLDLPPDEIYIQLEQMNPIMTLMETTLKEGTFPQCVECISPWGGRIISFIPGHKPEITSNPALIQNIVLLIDFLKCGSEK